MINLEICDDKHPRDDKLAMCDDKPPCEKDFRNMDSEENLETSTAAILSHLFVSFNTKVLRVNDIIVTSTIRPNQLLMETIQSAVAHMCF